MRWGTNEHRVGKVTRGGGGPMRRGTNESCVTRITLGDQ